MDPIQHPLYRRAGRISRCGGVIHGRHVDAQVLDRAGVIQRAGQLDQAERVQIIAAFDHAGVLAVGIGDPLVDPDMLMPGQPQVDAADLGGQACRVVGVRQADNDIAILRA